LKQSRLGAFRSRCAHVRIAHRLAHWACGRRRCEHCYLEFIAVTAATSTAVTTEARYETDVGHPREGINEDAENAAVVQCSANVAAVRQRKTVVAATGIAEITTPSQHTAARQRETSLAEVGQWLSTSVVETSLSHAKRFDFC
jgi:hypothetical protein